MSFNFEKYEDGANSVTNVVRTSKVEAEFKLAKEAFDLALANFKEARNCFRVKTTDKTEIESKLKEGIAKFLSAKGAQSVCYEIKERTESA